MGLRAGRLHPAVLPDRHLWPVVCTVPERGAGAAAGRAATAADSATGGVHAEAGGEGYHQDGRTVRPPRGAGRRWVTDEDGRTGGGGGGGVSCEIF